jgi:hypothetical protein
VDGELADDGLPGPRRGRDENRRAVGYRLTGLSLKGVEVEPVGILELVDEGSVGRRRGGVERR